MAAAEPSLAVALGSTRKARAATLAAGWLLVAACALGRFFYLGEGDLTHWDESLYAWRAKVAVLDGAWLDQSEYSFNGFYSGCFPPLFIWKMGAMFQLFGFEEWAARFPAAVLGALALFGLGACGWLTGGRLAGFLAAILLGAHFYFARFSRAAQMDGPCAAWMVFTVAAWLAATRFPEKRRRYAILCGLCMGCGLMTKIAAPALLAIAMAGSQALWVALGAYRADGESALAQAKRYLVDDLIAAGAALAVWAPWHLYMTLAHGSEFWRWYIGYHLLDRRNEVLDAHSGAWWFYPHAIVDRVPTAFLTLLVGAVFAAVASLFRALLPGDGEAKRAARGRLAAWAPAMLWTLSVGAILQSSTTKRETYLLFVYPGMALWAALYVAELLQSRSSRWGEASALGLAATLELMARAKARSETSWLLFTGEVEPFAGGTVAGEIASVLGPLLAAGLASGAIAGAASWLVDRWRTKRGEIPLGRPALQLILAILLATSLWRQGIEPLFSAPKLGLLDNAWIEMKDWANDAKRYPILGYLDPPGQFGPQFMYYLNGNDGDSHPSKARRIERLHDVLDPSVLDPFKRPGGAVIVRRWSGDMEIYADADDGRAKAAFEGFELAEEKPLFYIYVWPESAAK